MVETPLPPTRMNSYPVSLKISPSMMFQDARNVSPTPKNKPQLSETLPSTIVQQPEEDDMTVK